jgi:hypothetical protein
LVGAVVLLVCVVVAMVRRAAGRHGKPTTGASKEVAKANVSFDEYKMYYETTEQVTDRRQSANRWNYSVALALLVAIAVVVKWASDKPANLAAGLFVVEALSGTAIIFCYFWRKEIQSFKSLNAAKFEVLNDMAGRVRYEDAVFRSDEPFRKEWELLSRAGEAKPVRPLKGRFALASSGPELFLPKAFGLLFLAIALSMGVAAGLGWNSTPRMLSPFSVPTSSTSPSGVTSSVTMTPPVHSSRLVPVS